MKRRPNAPAPLLLLLGAVTLVVVAWALLPPPLQAPDEPWHFAYAQSVAERGELPGDADRPGFSTEHELLAVNSRAATMPFNPGVSAPFSSIADARWRARAATLGSSARGDGGGPNNAGANPPLYYAWEAIPYRVAGGDMVDRLYAMRLWSGLLLLVTVVGTWLLAGELFARNRLLQFFAAAVAGLQPMAGFIAASVNPDALLIALFALSFWTGVRILNTGLTLRWGALHCALAAAAALTKAPGYLLVVTAAGVIAYGLWRRRGESGRVLLRAATVCFLVVAIPVGGWLVAARAEERPTATALGSSTGTTVSVTSFDPSYLASYLWQFYLPRPGFLTPIPGVNQDYGYDTWFRTTWGAFGWKEVRLPDQIYSWLRWISYAVLLAAAAAIALRKVRLRRSVALLLGVTALGLLLGLHWVEFRYVVQLNQTFIQGRYFLPLLPLFACAGAAALALLPGRARGVAAGIALAGLIGLQALSLGAVLERFYA